MDNELEIVGNDAIATEAMVCKPSALATYGPIAGGVVAGIAIGALLYRFVATPLIAKYKAKKEVEKIEVNDEPKSEE